jgi:two-component system OmpR family sensor kinase
VIDVIDNGPGLLPEELPRVFDRFFRGKLAASGHVPGSGLGLSIARAIMHAHGGDLTVDSQQGQGCTLSLRLPART